jgi:hypothetical protein
MRKIVLGAVAAATALVAVPAAHAVNATQSMDVSVSKLEAGTKARPTNVLLSVKLRTTPKDDQAFATKRTVVLLDKYLKFNPKFFKSCSKATLDSRGPTACPKGSKIGSGKAIGRALGQTENLTVTAFNGPGGNKIELYVQGSAPLQINSTIEGVLKNSSGRYGKKLDVTIPANLQQPLTGVYATLTYFETNIKGTVRHQGKRRGYVETIGCARKWYFAATLTFTDNSSLSASDTVACAKHKRG